MASWGLPGCPRVRTRRLHCRGRGLRPWGQWRRYTQHSQADRAKGRPGFPASFTSSGCGCLPQACQPPGGPSRWSARPVHPLSTRSPFKRPACLQPARSAICPARPSLTPGGPAKPGPYLDLGHREACCDVTGLSGCTSARPASPATVPCALQDLLTGQGPS